MPPATPGRRRQRLGVRRALLLIWLVVGCVVSLAVCEVVVRVFDLGPRPLIPLDVGAFRLAEDPTMRYEFVPGYRRELRGGNGETVVERINDAGFRDRDYPREKPDGVVRVIVLGDSVTAGMGIPRLEDTYPKVLDSLFATSAPGRHVEVLNFGVSGYDTAQEVAIFEDRGLGFDPDVVVLAFCMNDFWRNSDGGLYARLLRATRQDGDGVAVLTPDSSSLLRHSRLAFLFDQLFRAARVHETSPDEALLVTYTEAFVAEGLRRLAELSEQHGFRCVIVVIPGFRGSFDDYEYRETHERLAAVNQEVAGLPVIDLFDDFAATRTWSPDLAIDGLHPTPEGVRLLAGFLHDRLVELYPDLFGPARN